MDDCLHCDPEHEDSRMKNWGVFIGPERDGDNQPTHLRVMPADGAHVAESDAKWLWELIKTYGGPVNG